MIATSHCGNLLFRRSGGTAFLAAPGSSRAAEQGYHQGGAGYRTGRSGPRESKSVKGASRCGSRTTPLSALTTHAVPQRVVLAKPPWCRMDGFPRPSRLPFSASCRVIHLNGLQNDGRKSRWDFLCLHKSGARARQSLLLVRTPTRSAEPSIVCVHRKQNGTSSERG